MKCQCGSREFIGRQAVRGTLTVIVAVGERGRATFLRNPTKDGLIDSSELDCDDPEGPFACAKCGARLEVRPT